ncbi:hypothetical protein [Rhodovulum steppense]|uniref:Uncharacterized protein n=1 Tax=Rhodovulum steppense TaxID=540251 RepID=A0A4R1YU31_9RHOB|nr:hypothetical protein [Rhodovulum steppense]TCM84591.1 hypothetical protein EV216_11173 [Rhodovulum steppense]
MTRRNHRNGGGKALHVSDLEALARRHLPEIAAHPPGHPSRRTPRENLWRTIKARPEIIQVLDALAERHEQATGQKITNSEIIAAALKLSLPVLASRMFPRADD